MSITSGRGGSGQAAECQTSVDDFGLDLPRRRASADAATGPRLGARGAWLMALGEGVESVKRSHPNTRNNICAVSILNC